MPTDQCLRGQQWHKGRHPAASGPVDGSDQPPWPCVLYDSDQQQSGYPDGQARHHSRAGDPSAAPQGQGTCFFISPHCLGSSV